MNRTAIALLFIALAGCSSGPSPGVTRAAPPGATFPDGAALAGTCLGEVYVQGSVGWLFCDDGVWVYSDVEPGDTTDLDMWTPDAGDAGSEDADASGTGDASSDTMD